MLEYKIKTYYPENISYKDSEMIWMDYFYSSLAESRIYYGKTFTLIKLYQLAAFCNFNCESINVDQTKVFSSLFDPNNNILRNNYDSYQCCNIDKLHFIITMDLFLKELIKNKSLLNDEIFLSIDPDYIVNLEIDETLLPKENQRLNSWVFESIGFSEFQERIEHIYNQIKKYSLLFENNFDAKKHKNIIYLHLKCSIIAAYEVFKINKTLAKHKRKISNKKSTGQYINSVKKFNETNIDLIRKARILLYSKNKINVFLNIDRGYFISKFDTYNNIESIKNKDTLLGFIEHYYENDEDKYRIVLSNKILEYFDYLRKNKKKEPYKEDFSKLTKCLNAIKSFSVLKNIPMIFDDIEKNIKNIKIKINKENIRGIMYGESLSIIPQNLDDAIIIKSIFDKIDNCRIFFNTFKYNYVIDQLEKINPIKQYTKEEMIEYIKKQKEI